MAKNPWPPELRAAPAGTCRKCGAETRAWEAVWRILCVKCWQELPASHLSDAACVALYLALARRRRKRR